MIDQMRDAWGTRLLLSIKEYGLFLIMTAVPHAQRMHTADVKAIYNKTEIKPENYTLHHYCTALFASLIICFFQLVFSVGTMFFSHNKSAGTMFRLVFSAKRTGP